ncbi:MAG: hypothetical protein COW01_07590 [Bdellovibrionales bacterium CG12_big_fil_rev_8_21_14_0_65_38_15]|nr:MAG: hypothetical protein COW79_01470 [Bdellovibrionales bacterium CG22_combo_CG10-13_8_21_14_all_38_13]PIQ55232.1 MAG: hypothetical protein COW01_07590 [Bdellovibrionales bacterium CG12_big_fil_rev_8_21_14_0_65_38_15]PIR30520.1 MAG: hypothetical protein COV38_05060 [Bdellovibrionales bacterium CG11_big_fil_rev_8_21_14_0_20_38_13]
MSYMKADEQDEKSLKKAGVSDFKSLVFLLGFSKEQRLRYFYAFGLVFLSSLVAIISARWTGYFVEEGLMPRNFDRAVYWAAGIFIMETLSVGMSWWGRNTLADSAAKTILSIRQSLFDHLQVLPVSYYDRQPQGRIMTRVTHDVEAIEDFFSSVLGRLFAAVMLAGIAAAGMMISNWKLGIVSLISMVPAIYLVYATRHRVRKVNRDMSRLSSMLNARLAEFLSGIPVIRSFGLEKWSQARYDKSVDEYLGAHLKANWLYSWSRPLISFFCSLPFVALVWYAGHEIIAGVLSVGVFTAFIRYADRFFNPMQMLAREIHQIQQALTNSERVSVFLQEATESKTLGPDGELADISLAGEVEFKNVSMAYANENWVLKDVSFKLNPGECVGLVGTTGSGKTTTVSLLSRLYNYQKGAITLDGTPLEKYKRSFLRRSIGFVSQETILFRSSLRINLTLEESFSAEEIDRAVKLTGLAKVMKAAGLTLDSLILDNGANLSIGEKQLVSLTRILLRDPALLVLDEATANVDPAYEKIIQDALRVVMQGRTCLIIAHRLHTLEICDRILVFKNGELVESGDKDSLEKAGGAYQALVDAALRSNDYLN